MSGIGENVNDGIYPAQEVNEWTLEDDESTPLLQCTENKASNNTAQLECVDTCIEYREQQPQHQQQQCFRVVQQHHQANEAFDQLPCDRQHNVCWQHRWQGLRNLLLKIGTCKFCHAIVLQRYSCVKLPVALVGLF